ADGLFLDVLQRSIGQARVDPRGPGRSARKRPRGLQRPRAPAGDPAGRRGFQKEVLAGSGLHRSGRGWVSVDGLATLQRKVASGDLTPHRTAALLTALAVLSLATKFAFAWRFDGFA